MSKSFFTVRFDGDAVVMLDQRLIPEQELYHTYRSWQEVADSIVEMVVRGAPAIGITAAFGIALGARSIAASDRAGFLAEFGRICDAFTKTRPTAVNLFWAITRMRGVCEQAPADASPSDLKALLDREARLVYDEDVEICRMMGEHGKVLVEDGFNILSHCNAGALATSDYGTSLSVIRAAHAQGKRIHVYSDETRPYLQGARLTAWELHKDGIPVTVNCDNMAGYLMAQGKVDMVITGADRIAANGDTANKIGTYSIAVLARHHGIPFYVAAPLSTIDVDTPDGGHIPIEERRADEITHFNGKRIVPEGVPVYNPSFDPTPSSLIAAIVTEKGILRPPFSESIAKVMGR